MVSRDLTTARTRREVARRALVIITLLLSVLGLLFVFEASVAEAFATFGDAAYLVKLQAQYLAIGLVLAIVVSRLPSQWWYVLAPTMFVVSLVLLAMVFVPGIGRELNGAYRWIFLGPVRFQPVEVVKITTALFFGRWLSQRPTAGPWLIWTAIPVVLLMLQPDFGSALLIVAVTTGLFFISGGSSKMLTAIVGLGVVLAVIAVLASPYRASRLTTFLNPERDPLGSGFQSRQMTLALGRGGLLGQGIGNSRQKFAYIPEASSDAIFAIIAEEVGFLGATAIILLYAGYGVCVVIIARTSDSAWKGLMVTGFGIWIVSQVFLNIGAVIRLIPLTGEPLPFISYGGTALVSSLVATGLIIGLSRESKS